MKKNRRGAPEAVEKRKVARLINDLIMRSTTLLDGRTGRRRVRLFADLAKHADGTRRLKPLDVIVRVDALLKIGETSAAIKKACPLPRLPSHIDRTELARIVRRFQRAYDFSVEAYAFVGVPRSVLDA